MWLIGNVINLVKTFNQRWIRHLYLTRKWSLMFWIQRFFVLLAIFFTLIVLYIIYTTISMEYNSYITSDSYLLQMSPRVKIPDRDRSRCCQGLTDHLDMCRRPGCIWPCPYSNDNQQVKFAKGDKAFVLETSGATYLDFRQACSVESLAYHNPNLTIYLLMTSPNVESISMSALTRNYPNLHVTAIDLASYIAGTPLERWYFCTEWNRGWYAVAHLSDALRLLTLSKYGGYYFDLDVIHVRPVTPYRNFAVAESEKLVANGIIHVDYQHPVMQSAIDEFATNYKWHNWIHNGPALLTRILQRFCQVNDISSMTSERCHGFQVLSPPTFFPIGVRFTIEYFKQRSTNEKIQLGESVIAAHIYNQLTTDRTIYKNSDQFYVQLARSSCPRVLDAAPNQF